MSVNFDAKLSLDVSQFLSGVKKAESALKGLEAQIDRINAKSVSPRTQANVAMPSVSGTRSSIAQRRAEAQEEDALFERRTRQAQNNAKVEWQAEMMRKKSMDDRIKDHNSRSAMVDDSIRMAEKEQKNFSNLIKNQMQEREKMNKLHATANRMNEQFDKRRASQEANALRGLARERYALYDVAAAYAAVSAASIGTISAVVGTAVQYEKAFASVVRTTDFTSIKVGEAARVMRSELMQLANEIPVAFADITSIATIGNQLGIAQADLVNFTETVAKFAATTDVTVENAAMSFGRIGELLEVSDFNALGSAIAFAGVNAVATETQILAVTKEIATTAKQAKFSASEVVGLATALGSLGIAPEAARGSIIRSFAAINAAISNGGASLQGYANIAGMTAEQFASTWQDNGAKAFDALLKGLQASSDSGQNLDTVLRGLGVRNVRDIQTLQKLGDNYDVYAQSVRDANKAFEEGSFLSQSYGVVQETVAAKLGVVQNQINNLLAGMGESTSGPIKIVLDSVSALLLNLQRLSNSPIGQAMGGLIVSMAALAAAVATVNGVVALSRAAMLAYATAMGTVRTNADGAVIGLNRAATAAKIFNVTLNSIKVGLLIAAVTTALSAISELFRSTESKAEGLLGGFGGLQDAVTQDTAAIKENAAAAGMSLESYAKMNNLLILNTQATVDNTGKIDEAARIRNNLGVIIGEEPGLINGSSDAIKSQTLIVGENTAAWIKNAIASSDAFKAVAGNQDAINALTKGGYNFDDALRAASGGQQSLDNYFNSIVNKYKSTIRQIDPRTGNFKIDWQSAVNAQNAIGEINKIKTVFSGAFGQLSLLGLGGLAPTIDDATQSTKGLNDELTGTSKTIRTVLDYASDLAGILQRVSDIKLGRQLAKDEIAEGWEKIAEEAEEAERAIRSANAEIQELTADKAVIEYQLAVAQRYGDEKRAAVLRAKLTKIDEKMTDAQDDLTKAQTDANKSLTGNTKAARENRDALAGMVDKYQDYIVALVQSGLKGKALEDAIAALKRQFEAQAKAVGFADDELKPYLDTFDNFKEVVEKLPRNVDVQFNSNISAAQQALNEYEAKLKALNGKSATVTITQKEGIQQLTTLLKPIVDSWTVRAMGNAFMYGAISAKEYYKGVYGIDLAAPGGGGFMQRAAGGPVFGPGTSTSDSIPAMLSNGEYVVRAKAVRTYGLDFMNAINGMKPVGSMGGFAGGTAGVNSVTIAQLSPEDRALLRAAVDRPINLYADSKKIAQTANDGNNLIARRGVR